MPPTLTGGLTFYFRITIFTLIKQTNAFQPASNRMPSRGSTQKPSRFQQGPSQRPMPTPAAATSFICRSAVPVVACACNQTVEHSQGGTISNHMPESERVVVDGCQRLFDRVNRPRSGQLDALSQPVFAVAGVANMFCRRRT
jgi:hypothetical protein